MILNSKLGNTTKTGIAWEVKTDFNMILSDTYKICNTTSELIDLDNGNYTGIFNLKKNKFYEYLLKKHGIDWRLFLSTRICGDEVILNSLNKSVFFVEKKTQQRSGSVDEKLQTGDFKKKQLQRICNTIGYKAHYIYLLNDWFKQPKYKDAIEYNKTVGCEVFFNKIDENRMSEILYIPSN